MRLKMVNMNNFMKLKSIQKINNGLQGIKNLIQHHLTQTMDIRPVFLICVKKKKLIEGKNYKLPKNI